MAELKPCPFCGGKARIHGTDYCWITCGKCLASTRAYNTKEKAIEAWNRREGDK